MSKTPIQHARTALRQLRSLITTLSEAKADGVNFQFVQAENESPDAQATMWLNSVSHLHQLDGASIGVTATTLSRIEVAASDSLEGA